VTARHEGAAHATHASASQETPHDQSHRSATSFSEEHRSRCHRRRRPGRAHGLAGADHLAALPEHLALEGHLPRVRPGLRQEGERDGGRAPEDRGAACRRGGAGLPVARGGEQGHARRRPWRGGLSLRQELGAGAVGLGSGLRHGPEHGAGVARIRRRQGAARGDLQEPEHGRGVLSLRTHAHAAARLVQEAGGQVLRHEGPEVPYRGSGGGRVHRHGRGGEPAARRRDRAGARPRPDRRGRVQQRLERSGARLPRRGQELHAAELSPRAASSSRSCSTPPSSRRFPTNSRPSSTTACRPPAPT